MVNTQCAERKYDVYLTDIQKLNEGKTRASYLEIIGFLLCVKKSVGLRPYAAVQKRREKRAGMYQHIEVLRALQTFSRRQACVDTFHLLLSAKTRVIIFFCVRTRNRNYARLCGGVLSVIQK